MRPLPVICLAGPTGSGKTALAVELAQKLNCEIINADSRQVYADFPIITAQPTPAEKRDIPHHLYGFLQTKEKINAGKWAEMALAKASDICARGKIPLLVGGTGFYFHSLLEGLAAIPPIPAEIKKTIGDEMARQGPEEMYRTLLREDPEYASHVHPRDKNRIGRALEVWLATGRSFTWWHKNSRTDPLCQGPLLVLNASLASLGPRLEKRIGSMLAQGALDEARRAYASCQDLNTPGWSGIGCAEIGACLAGRLSMEECARLWQSNTRAYAKRQITWFRSRRETIWTSGADVFKTLKASITQWPETAAFHRLQVLFSKI